MLKILHCADLHLDSPFSGLNPIKSEERRREQRELFRNLACFIRNQRIDLLLIAGDLFDSRFTCLDTVKYVTDHLKTIGCQVVISPGNHDPYISNGIYSSDFPDNVHIFSSERLSCFDIPDLGVCVYGYAFTKSTYPEHPLACQYNVDPERLNILCAHGDIIQSLSKYAPISPKELEDSPFEYAALGHIHNAPEPVSYNGTIAAYCGCTEGRSYDELDFGGAILIEAEGKKISTKKIKLAKRRYMIERLDITGENEDTSVIEKIKDIVSLKRYGDDTSLRIILQGAVSPEYTPDLTRISSSLAGLYSVQLKDETLPTLDEEQLEGELNVRGEFYRTLCKVIREGTQEERDTAILALRLGLAALDEKPIILSDTDK